MKERVGTEKTSIRNVSGRSDRPNKILLTVQFFQGQLLGLSDEAEDHEPGDEVKASIETD
jgi:hypothetical protein